VPASRNDPRANQKERTRAAIVDAAARLLRDGGTASVAQAAEAARVSRATAYRYFPKPDDLVLEVAAVTPAMAPVESALASLASADVAERLAVLQEAFHAVVLVEEAQMRAALRAYLDTWLSGRRKSGRPTPVREGRRMRWLDTVLAPARRELSEKQRRRLQAALALTLGMDAFIVMKDVCRLDDDEAKSVLRWAAQALLRAGLDEAHGAPPRSTTARAPASRTSRKRVGARA